MRLFKKPGHPLDDVLFRFPDGSPYRVRSMLESCEVKGKSGSGKSSGSLDHFLDCLAAHPRATITMLAQKPEDKAQVMDIFARHGRKRDLIVIEPGGKQQCNFFQSAVASGADPRAVVELLGVLSEGLQAQAGAREGDRFFRMAEDRCNYNAAAVLALGDTVSAPNLLEFYGTALYDPKTLDDEDGAEAWRAKYHHRVMRKAALASKTAAQANDWRAAMPFWSSEFPAMDDKPRTSILAGVMNTLHTAVTGLAAEMTSTINTVSPRVIDEGKSLLINMPVSTYGPTGRYVAGGWKYLMQKHILRRRWNPSNYFNVMVLDEFQESATDFDAVYLPQCRSHGGCMLCLTQTVASEYARMSNRHKAEILLSNYGLHIYHLSDPVTEEAASKLLGQRRETFVTPTLPGPAEPWDTFMGRSHASVSVSEQWQPVLHPGFLQRDLRTGGPDNHYCVDAYAIRPGQKFRNGEHYQFLSFKQR